MKLMLTCEHASNHLPASFKKAIPADVLKTHRAYDIGACAVFRKLVRFAKPEFYSEGKFSRLFVDLNRTLTNKSAFSEYYEALDKATATKAKAQASDYWKEYRAAIEKFVESALKSESRTAKSEPAIVHLGIHSFTPALGGVVRNADVGILYDPDREAECRIADALIREIKARAPELRIRRNYPYRGTSDGLTTALRQKFGEAYAGIEIEMNQALLAALV